MHNVPCIMHDALLYHFSICLSRFRWERRHPACNSGRILTHIQILIYGPSRICCQLVYYSVYFMRLLQNEQAARSTWPTEKLILLTELLRSNGVDKRMNSLNRDPRKAISIEGTLLMPDDRTPHVAVTVQAIHCDPDDVVWFGTAGGGVSWKMLCGNPTAIAVKQQGG
jgi:hypothetical protein